jgi:L-iditol 2-dehydrogenase
MQALVYRGADDLRIEEVPIPAIRSSEVLVRVEACGVCPTDIKKIHQALVPPPRIFGHETAGTVARVGSRVRGFRVGDRVAVHHHVPCLDCHYCRHRAFAQCATYRKTGVTAGFEPAGGGFAEYVRVLPFCLPGLVKIPRRISMAEAALLEPVNTVLKGVRMLQLQAGDQVLVMGQGPIGLLFNRLLALEGVRVIGCDPLEARCRLGRRFGAARALDPAANLAAEVDRMTRGRGLDGAVIATPSDEAFAAAHALVRGGGSTLVFAHTVRGRTTPLDLGRVCVDEQRVLGSYSSDFTLQREVARLVLTRRLDVRPLITHRYPLQDAAAAIERAAHPSPDTLKVMVEPGGTAGRPC